MDVGEILFGQTPDDPDNIDFVSPDNTSDGWLRKKWVIADGKRYLVKCGSGDYRQEPFNEVIASEFMKRLDVEHVKYTLAFDGDVPYSACENFVSPETELVPAWHIIQALKKNNMEAVIKKGYLVI